MSGDSYNGPVKIRFHDHSSDEIKELEWDWKEYQKELGLRARSVAEVYERYARSVDRGKGDDEEGYEFPTLEDGIELMREFDKLHKQHDPEW